MPLYAGRNGGNVAKITNVIERVANGARAMQQNDRQQDTDSEESRKEEPSLTLKDLLKSESEVLRRVAQSQANQPSMAGHYSTRSGHTSSGTHGSHSM